VEVEEGGALFDLEELEFGGKRAYIAAIAEVTAAL
jgi:hypothetical protein